MACQSELKRYAERYPNIPEERILEAIKSAGPLRRDVEAELERIAGDASQATGS